MQLSKAQESIILSLFDGNRSRPLNKNVQSLIDAGLAYHYNSGPCLKRHGIYLTREGKKLARKLDRPRQAQDVDDFVFEMISPSFEMRGGRGLRRAKIVKLVTDKLVAWDGVRYRLTDKGHQFARSISQKYGRTLNSPIGQDAQGLSPQISNIGAAQVNRGKGKYEARP